MKTQIHSRSNPSLSILGFLLLMTIPHLGCGVFYNLNRVMTRDPVLLTQDDLHRMGLGKSNLIRPLNDLFTIKGFQQRGSQLTVQYWLFNAAAAARKAAETEWVWLYAAPGNFHLELNPEDVIGDATWRRIHKNWKEWEKGSTNLYFVKYNLLVSVRAEVPPSNRLQFARDAARKIEAEIEAVLLKNGKTVISGGRESDRLVRLWNVETGHLLKTLKEHTSDEIESVSFSPDGKTIVSGDRSVRLWDVNTGDLLKNLNGNTGWITSVGFSPDGKRIVSGSYDDTVRLWDVETGHLLKTHKGHKWNVESVSFSPDGKTLASGSVDGSVWLWDIEMGSLLKTFEGHKGNVESVRFLPDGRMIVGSSLDGAILLWNTSVIKR